MSDLGDLGGEVAGMFIGVPVAIICVVCAPVMLIQKGCEMFSDKPKTEQVQKIPVIQKEVKKESLSFRAGQKTKESVKDFTRGLFSKSN